MNHASSSPRPFPAGTSAVRILLQLASAGSVVAGGLFWLDYSRASALQAYAGFYLCAAVLGCVLFFLLRDFAPLQRRGLPAAVRREWPVLLLSALGAGALFLHQPVMMRVFADEPAHMLTAVTMAQEQVVAVPGHGYPELGGFAYVLPEPVYRMYFYPFLVAIGAQLVGYQDWLPYAVNGGAAWLLFFLAHRLGHALTGSRRAGYLLQLLLFGLPLLAATATSAQYDLVNLAVLVGYLLACLRYFRSRDGAGLDLAVACGLLLAYCRSESILFLAIVGLLFAVRLVVKRRVEVTGFTIVAPFLLLGAFTARVIWKASAQQMADTYLGAEAGFFSTAYFGRNLGAVLDWLLSFSAAGLNSLFHVALFALAFAWLAWAAVARRRRLPGALSDAAVLGCCGAVFALHLLLVLLLYWDPTDPSAQRFFLPLYLYLSLVVVFAAGGLPELRKGPAFALLIALAAANTWFVALPRSARAEVSRASVPGAYSRWALDWARRNDDGRTLYAGGSRLLLLLHEYSAVELKALNRNPLQALLVVREGLYDRIVVFESRVFLRDDGEWGMLGAQTWASDKLRLKRIDGCRGFLDAELAVYQVTGFETGSGEVVEIAPGPPPPREFGSDAEMRDYIRRVQRGWFF